MILLARPRITASFRHQCSAPISLLQILVEISLLNYPEQTFDHVDYHIITSSKIKRLNLKFHWNHFISSTSLCRALWTLLNFCLAQSSFFVLKSNLTKIHSSPPVQRFVGLVKAMLVVFIGWILNTCSKQMPDKESCWERQMTNFYKGWEEGRRRHRANAGHCWRGSQGLKWYEDSNLPRSLKIASLWWSPPYWVPLYWGLAELIWRQFPAHQLCIISAPPHSPKYPSKNQKKKNLSVFSQTIQTISKCVKSF